MSAIVWIPAFAGMTGANRSGDAVIVPPNLAPTYPRKPIKGEGSAGGDSYPISVIDSFHHPPCPLDAPPFARKTNSENYPAVNP